MRIYVNLCKFMQIRWVCGILKLTMTKSTGYQPGWKHKLHYQKVCRNVQTCVEMTPTFLDKNTFLCRNCTVSKLPVWKCLTPLTRNEILGRS